MLEGKTSTGYKYKLDERIKKDWRLIKLQGVLQNGSGDEQIDACVTMINLIFKDKGASLEEHVAKHNDGFVPVDALMNEISEILKTNEELKKS